MWLLVSGFFSLFLIITASWIYYLKLLKTKENLILLDLLHSKELEIAKLTQSLENLKEQSNKLENELKELKNEQLHISEALHEARLKEASLDARLEASKESYQKLETSFAEKGKQLELKLHSIMQEGLESKLKKFDENSLKSLGGMLKPFSENLELFKRKIEFSQDQSTKKFAQLSKEIEFVTKAGFSITQEAQNLTNALKGKKQMQGSWGEMILESVLEYSGLLKGVHYETQSSFRDEQGRQKRPDVIIKLPSNRSIIIDSKVSLNDYDAYIRSENDEERSLSSKALVRAFRQHIDTLELKDYAHYDAKTLQYVFMFVPVEGAFALAVQEEPRLYEYALKKHIAIVTPSTLTVSLRTIYLYWQSEQSTSNAQKLFMEAGRLYDKMHIFSETFTRLGAQIGTIQNSYEIATKQLSSGQGNLLTRTQRLKTLGAKTTKQLDNTKFLQDDFDEEIKEVSLKEDSK